MKILDSYEYSATKLKSKLIGRKVKIDFVGIGIVVQEQRQG